MVGLPHHITQRGTDRQRVFYTDSDREVYLSLLRISAEQARLRILAYCLMTNHVHLVAVPEEASSMMVALRRAHGRYAAYLNVRRARTGHLWQNRFYSCALDGPHTRVALRYVERNPGVGRLSRLGGCVSVVERLGSSKRFRRPPTPRYEFLDGAGRP